MSHNLIYRRYQISRGCTKRD